MALPHSFKLAKLIFDFSTGILAGGTALGSVALWHYKANPNYRNQKQRYDEGSQWELLAPCEAGDAVVDLKVGAPSCLYLCEQQSRVTERCTEMFVFSWSQRNLATRPSPSCLRFHANNVRCHNKF